MFEQAWFFAFWGIFAMLALLERLFPQRPAQADRGRRWPTNFGLGILNSVIASLGPALTVWSTQWAANYEVGVLNWISVPWWPAFFVSVIIQSLANYGLHLYAHVNPALWRLHRIHHSDVHLDVTSTLRHHPLEVIAMTLLLTPIYVIGGLSPFAIVFYETADQVFGMVTHADLRIPDQIERMLRPLFVTPSIHRIHHSAIQAETNSNYGGVFSFWDRLFGTFCGASLHGKTPVALGLEDVDQELAGDFIGQLKLPWHR